MITLYNPITGGIVVQDCRFACSTDVGVNSWVGRTASAVLATSRASTVLHAYTKTTDAAKLRVGDPNRSPNRLQSLSCAICALTCKPTHGQMLQKLISRSHLALTPISPAPASRPLDSRISWRLKAGYAHLQGQKGQKMCAEYAVQQN